MRRSTTGDRPPADPLIMPGQDWMGATGTEQTFRGWRRRLRRRSSLSRRRLRFIGQHLEAGGTLADSDRTMIVGDGFALGVWLITYRDRGRRGDSSRGERAALDIGARLELAERLKAALLKSVESQDSVGSNPTLSATDARPSQPPTGPPPGLWGLPAFAAIQTAPVARSACASAPRPTRASRAIPTCRCSRARASSRVDADAGRPGTRA